MVTTQSNPITQAAGVPAAAAEAAPRRRPKSLGQSLAEFALTVPFALFMVLFGLDFGRVFLGWVSLNQAAREAANYAAMNPTAWSLPYNLTAQAEYTRLVQAETTGINCVLQSPVPAPSFSSGTSIGAPATVAITCQFRLITPFIGLLLGNPIPVSASSAFPVRSGNIEGVPLESTTPSATPAPTASPGPTATPAPSGAPTAGPSATPAPSPTPAQCTVVSLLDLQTNKAAAAWLAGGFSGGVVFSPLVPPNYRIAWQSLTVGTTTLCTAGITVRSGAP
jgi:TadE-like protein